MKVWDLHCDTLYELRRAEKAGAPKSFLLFNIIFLYLYLFYLFI